MSRLLVRFWYMLPLLLVAAQASADSSVVGHDRAPSITVIIDDLGYSLRAGKRVLALPGPVVVAVLPHTPRARMLSELAAQSGKEVLLHLPLQSMADDEPAEPGHITLDMSQAQFSQTLLRNLDAVPNAIGVNGHKGSLLTRHPGHMRWLMEEVAARDLLFVDSYTTHLSVAVAVADEVGVPVARRDVFLDADPEAAEIAREFERLKSLATQHGSAIAIGHPHASTLKFLEGALPKLRHDGFRLVGIRRLLAERAHAADSRYDQQDGWLITSSPLR